MEKNLLILFIVLLLIISGCINTKKDDYESNLGDSCKKYSECKLPMEYAIQSNCPFGTACIDSRWKVICPLFYHDPIPEISKSYHYECNYDKDCNCSQRIHSIKCICLDKSCVSVEAE